MKRTRAYGWVLGALHAVVSAGCAPESTETRSVDEVHVASAFQAEPPARPVGWGADSHGDRAEADYARLFVDDRVQRIDIEIAPPTHAQLLDDLGQRLGTPGSRTGSPAAAQACVGLARDAPCRFLELEGRCASSGGALTCRASDQVGALDMVPGDPVMLPVTIRYDGLAWHHVGMRFKGNSSLTGPWRSGIRKLGFRLDFDKYEDEHPELKNQRFFGFDKLTFSSGYSDSSLIREKLASDLLRDVGLVAARTAFYRLFVDVGSGPEYWGLYTMVEDPADKLASAQFSDGSGNLYKPDGVGADFTRFDAKGFEKKSNQDAADYGDVLDLFSALHAPREDAAAWRRGLEATLDVDAFLHNLAVGRAIDHWDGYGQMAHNYYLYGDPAQDGRLVWISWDHNMTWSSARGRTSIMADNIGPRWPLISFVMSDVVYRARYRALLDEFISGVYEKTSFDARATAMHALVAPYVVGPEGERPPYTHLRNAAAFQSGLTTIIAAADGRRAAHAQARAREIATLTPPASEEPAAQADDARSDDLRAAAVAAPFGEPPHDP